MKKVDSGEYFETNQYKEFLEYKPFHSEKYYTFEIAKSPLEDINIDESFNNQSTANQKTQENSKINTNESKRQLNEIEKIDLTSNTGNTLTSTSTISSSSTVTATASASSATIGATAIVSAVIILVAVTTSFFANIATYISDFIGTNYFTLTINIDDFIASQEESYNLNAQDFILQIDTNNGTQNITMQSGKCTYLVTGLNPNTTYTYKIICNNSGIEDNDYYTHSFTTPAFGEPTGVFDEMNNFIYNDETNINASLEYSVYLSDYNNKYPNAKFYVCESEQLNASIIQNIIYTSDILDENNFFKGIVENITSEKVYLYIVGENEESNKTFLFSHTLNTNLPTNIPKIEFLNEVDFNGEYFTISYNCDMIHDYNNASLIFEISNGIDNYIKQVDNVSNSGMVILDCIPGEPGKINIVGKLSYKDSISGKTYILNSKMSSYEMFYSISNISVNANLSTFGTSNDFADEIATIPITIKFNSKFLPNNYKICIQDTLNYVDIEIPVTQEYCYFNTIDINSDDEITLTIKDSKGNIWGSTYTYNISSANANANYTHPSTMNCANPGDALVTYNEDGTINIYRKINFSCDNENVYYNAFIYSDYYDENGIRTYINSYDIIGRDKYAIIENIPKRNYMLLYCLMFDYDGVSYIMYTEMPSGAIEFYENYGTAEITVSENSTTINIYIEMGLIDNKIIIDGVEYTYTTYEDIYEQNPTLVIDGEYIIDSVIVFHNQYYNYYVHKEYLEELTLQGDLFNKVTIFVNLAS